MPTTRTNLKKILAILVAIAIVIYLSLAALDKYVIERRYGDCEEYAQRLNGGEREYQGKKYKVVLCGTGGDSNQDNDRIRMQIFSEGGELVAQRKFIIHWDTPNFEKKMEYHDDHITYFDMSDNNDFEKIVSMPPTFIDRIRARIPLLD